VSLGNRTLATRHYQASSELYRALGDEQRAAQQQANSAALRIEYGDEPQAALRDIESALGVFQKLGDNHDEAFCLRLIAAYYRQAGRHADAERELNRALAALRERDLEDDIDAVTVDRARSLVETGNYAAATMLLDQVVANNRPRSGTAAHVHLARIRHRLGDTAGAEAELALARGAAEDSGLAPLFFLVTGQVAFDRDLFPAARAAFLRAAALWTETLPDAASVEARAWIGYLDVLDGRATDRALIQTSLEQAARMDRPALVARCRLFLALADLRQKRNADALNTINQIPPDEDDRTIGPELLAQLHYWRSVALAGTGNRDGALADLATARRLVNGLAEALPEADRATFTGRADIRRIVVDP
jgi:tetratricopeptide (TPR) repeat protein